MSHARLISKTAGAVREIGLTTITN